MSFTVVDAQAQVFDIKGSIHHTEWNPKEQSVVTFSSMPQDYESFVAAQEALATEPQGVVALQLMGMELYRRDPVLGEKCLALVNTETNMPGMLRIIKEMFMDSEMKKGYIIASYMDGATPDNGYNPKTPYQIQVRVNPASRYQESDFLRGYVLYLQVKSTGYDTQWRGVEVVRLKGEKYYRVSNCPAMYTKCKEISWKTDAEFNGLEMTPLANVTEQLVPAADPSLATPMADSLAVGSTAASADSQAANVAPAEEEPVLAICEVMPSFPGGDRAMAEYLTANMIYPAECADANVQGRVMLEMVVEKDGTLTNFNEMRSPDSRLTAEAIRLALSMPRWTPGMQGGKPVRAKYIMTVTFRL